MVKVRLRIHVTLPVVVESRVPLPVVIGEIENPCTTTSRCRVHSTSTFDGVRFEKPCTSHRVHSTYTFDGVRLRIHASVVVECIVPLVHLKCDHAVYLDAQWYRCVTVAAKKVRNIRPVSMKVAWVSVKD